MKLPTSIGEIGSRARYRLAAAILPAVIDRVDVDVVLHDKHRGRRYRPSGGEPTIVVHDHHELLRHLAAHPKIGIGESYTAGVWDAADGHDLALVLTPFAAALGTAFPPYLLKLRRLVDRRLPHWQRNSREGSRRNIAAHYDLSNDLFALFLDDSMTYSAALFEPAERPTHRTLPTAQRRKIAAALDRARVREGSRVLEIGTGWGALAIAAAQRGARVTSITLSREQAELARARAQAAGVADRVTIDIADYRDTTGSYDAVISIEMLEAVGEEFWPTYFTTIEARLAPGGSAVIQTILMDDDRLMATRGSYGWIQKHIFPGGLIPSLKAIERVATQHTTLAINELSTFGSSYADTLALWRHSFDDRVDEVRALGFDERFIRTWRFYLAYSEAGFRSRYLDVAQIRLERPLRRNQ